MYPHILSHKHSHTKKLHAQAHASHTETQIDILDFING